VRQLNAPFYLADCRRDRVEDYPDELDDQSSPPPSPTLPGSSSIHPSTPAPLVTGSDAELASICRNFLIQLQQGPPWVGQRINSTYGEPPSDIESLSYYVASVLPINDQEKAKLLPIRTSSLRLRLVVHWIEQLSDNWFVSSLRTRKVLCRSSLACFKVVHRGLYHSLEGYVVLTIP